MKKEKGFSLIRFILMIFLLIIIFGFVGGFVWYSSAIKPLQTNSEKVVVDIKSGSGISGIADLLEANNVIKDATAFKIYCKLNDATSMQAGKYELDKNMSVEQIVTELKNGNVVDETVKITFIEGKNMRWIASTIASATDNTEEDVFNLLQDEEYINSVIEKYWFVTDDIKNSEIYYPLEGYLFPDTYILSDKSESVETIFGKMLDRMEEVLEPLQRDIQNSDYSIHEILSFASVVELEAGKDNRAEVAGVFYNRLNRNMGMQSDVTTYYALKLDLDERELTRREIASENPYNTSCSSMAGKLPIGPIAMVDRTSINAVLHPKETDALFFVADKDGNIYFSRTNEEHEQIVQELKDRGLWYTYDE